MPKEINPSLNGNKLFDRLLDENNLKNDAALSRELEVSAPVISKLRHGKLPFGPSIILAIHEKFGMPVKEIRAVLA